MIMLLSSSIIFIFLYALGLMYFYIPDYHGILLFFNRISDLTANVTIALFVALVLEKLIDELKLTSRLQKTTRSRNYVKRRISSVYNNLIWFMQPPHDWKKRLTNPDSNWDDYYKQKFNVKENALHELETVLDRHPHLIDLELTNDILEMVELLSSRTRWMAIEPRFRHPLNLEFFASDVHYVMNESYETIKRHKLLETEHRLIISRSGETPKTTWKKTPKSQTTRSYIVFQEAVQEALRFKDACHNAIFKKE